MPLSDSHKHLGMVLDRKLNVKCYLSEKISNANKGIGIIQLLYNFLPRATLDYGDVIYDDSSIFCQMI